MPQQRDNTEGLRIAFAGTPDFAAVHLQALLAAKNHQLIAVYTQPDRPAGRGKKLSPSPVKMLAQQHDIPVFQPQTLRDSAAQGEFAALNLDLFVVVAYGLLIPQAILDMPRFGCINVHASLLPRWRGAAPIQRAIEAGDQQTGITIMQMDAGLDTGAMLHKVYCDIGPRETGGSLHDKLAALGPQALLHTLAAIADGVAQGQQQDDSQSCYAAKISKQEAEISWLDSATAIDRKIRAFNPFPVTFSRLGDSSLRIWAGNPLPGRHSQQPGAILGVTDQSVEVACGEGSLLITQAQLPGKKAMAIADILRGNPGFFTPGKTFGGAAT